MARLYINPGNTTYGPVPGGEVTEIIGSNQTERVWLAGNASAMFDPSFVRGNDTIVILGLARNYSIAATVAGITITSGNGANIRVPAFGTGGGLRIDFNDGTFNLGTDDSGVTFKLTSSGGVQEIGNSASVIGSGGSGGSGANFSLDIGTPGVARVVDASTGSFAFTDNAEATTNVRITGMTSNDRITVTNATASDYNFQRDFADIRDLVITYTDTETGATNMIVVDNVLPDTGAVSTLAAATSAIGFNFMTFA
jgi:hypothetical protein